MSPFFQVLWASLTLLLSYIYILRPSFRPRQFPPGPRNLPIIGGLHHIRSNFLDFVQRMHQIHGNVFSFNVGSQPCVVLGDFDFYKQLANMDDFTWRPHDIGLALRDARYPDSKGNMAGLFFSNGKEWQEQRKFLLKNLRDFGFGKLTMARLIQDEVAKSKTLLGRDLEKPVSLTSKLNFAMFNALWHLMSGETLSYDDTRFKILFEKSRLMLSSGQQVGFLDFFPWLKYVAPKMSGYWDVYQPQIDVQDFIKEVFHEHDKTYQEEHLRDLIDSYIKMIQLSDNHQESSFHGQRGEENMAVGLMDMFANGSETSASTLNWALFHLARNPSKQERLHQEIDAVIGKDRLPSVEDRSNMPYMEAVMTEVHRLSSLAFVGVMREVKNSVDIGPYHLPRGTKLIPSNYWIMHDPKYWSNPESFIPERFIHEDSKSFEPDERCIPFGMGKRNCLGKNLAQVEFFLFLAGFVQSFEFVLPTEVAARELEPTVGFILGCPDYNIVLKERRKAS